MLGAFPHSSRPTACANIAADTLRGYLDDFAAMWRVAKR
jgi:hypothetical protein